jgi:hypothetical protein
MGKTSANIKIENTSQLTFIKLDSARKHRPTMGAVLAVAPNRPWHAESFGL